MQIATEHAFRDDARTQRDIRQICLALVWIKDDSTLARWKEVIDVLQARSEVESVERAPGKANVIMLRFDRGCISASEIVLDLRRSGIEAVLVDC
jgi:hypothetical protein